MDILPDEMLTIIFSYLSQNELGLIARVCKRWYMLTRNPVLWKKVDVILYDCDKSQAKAVKKLIAKLPSCVTSIKLDFRDSSIWIEKLNFEKLAVRLQQKCPHLKMLMLVDAILQNCLASIIHLCSKFLQTVKMLIIHFSEFYGPTAIEECYDFSNIEVLDVSWSDLVFYSKIPFSKIPHLKQLCVANTSASDYWFEDDMSFLNRIERLDLGRTAITPRTFQFVRNNGLSLQELYLCSVPLQDYDLVFNDSDLPHLKTICLRHCCAVSSQGIVTLIQSCKNVENVYVTQEVAHSYSIHPFVVFNVSKLGIVKVINCDDHTKINYECK